MTCLDCVKTHKSRFKVPKMHSIYTRIPAQDSLGSDFASLYLLTRGGFLA